jgi:hypothetical protein
MEYVEYLRVRTSLFWVVGIGAALTALLMMLGRDLTFDVQGASKIATGMTVPLATLVPIAGTCAAIYASVAGGSLNREFLMHDIAWTKPVSRATLALRFVLVDVAAVALVFFLAVLAILAFLAWVRVGVATGPTLVPELALGLGAGVMWYSLLQVLTFWFPPRALSLCGILWPISLTVDGLRRAPGLSGAIARALNVFNPLGYLSNPREFWTASLEVRVVAVWFLSVLFCGVAIAFWPRREA